MKKAKTLLASLLGVVAASTMAFGLAACGDTTNPDNQGGGENPTTVQLTDGVYSYGYDSNHVQLVKFKTDGTFYAQSLMQEGACFGKWELVDMEVEYISVNPAEGCLMESDDMTIKKSTQAIKFTYDDGSAYNVRDEYYYENASGDRVPVASNSGVAKNCVAYAEDKLHCTTFDNGKYWRTLNHDVDSTFGEEDEIKNLLYRFMVKDVPDWATEGGYIAQDLELTIYHNSFVDLASSENQVSGKLTVSGNVYTFDNGAKVTVAADGKSATYVKGDVTIDLVEWVKAATTVASVKANHPYIGDIVINLYDDGNAELTGAGQNFTGTYSVSGGKVTFNIVSGGAFTISEFTISDNSLTGTITVAALSAELEATGTITGKLAGSTIISLNTEWASMTFTLALNSDNSGSVAMADTVITTFHWALDNEDTQKIYFRNSTNGSVSFALDFTSGAPVAKFEWTGKLSDAQEEPMTLTFTGDATSLGALKTDAATAKLVVEGVPLENVPYAGASLTSVIYFYSDGTGVIDVNVAALNMTLNDALTFHWSMSTATNQIEFVEDEITFAMAQDYSTASFTATVTVGQLGEKELVFNVNPQSLSALR